MCHYERLVLVELGPIFLHVSLRVVLVKLEFPVLEFFALLLFFEVSIYVFNDSLL